MPDRGESGARGPVRTCIGCRKAGSQDDLVRLVADSSRRVIVDFRRVGHGRGAYVHPRPACLKKGLRTTVLKAVLRIPEALVPDPEAISAEITGLVMRRMAGLISSAYTTGNLQVGNEAGRDAVTNGLAKLLVMALDAGPSSKAEKAALRARVPILRVGTRSWLGERMGRKEIGAAVVTDPGLAAALERAGRLLPVEE